MKKISILNYGCGNLLSLERAVQKVGKDAKIISTPEEIDKSDLIILPGVGAFKNAMNLLNSKKFIMPLEKYTKEKKKPILGICLGMQLFFSKSYEMGVEKGLDYIPGEVVSIKNTSKIKDIKSPNINWNKLEICRDTNKIIPEDLINKSFYFIHSYMVNVEDNKNLIGYYLYYDLKIPAVVKLENIIGLQFHPEKSGKNGLKLLKNIFEILL